jgi:hypothetical protein
MTAQVVLQFPTSEKRDHYDKLIRFEEALISLLGESADVDGHDFGAGDMNVFILTEDPIATFAVVQQTDRTIRPSQEMRAAYRPIDGEDYVCLWPAELTQFKLA